MALVGDVIMSVRSQIPDMPGTLPPPALPAVSVVASAGSTLPPATYYVRCSVTTPWGESSASSESTQLTVGNGQAIQVGVGLTTLPLGAATLRVYFGPQGAENQFVDLTSLPAVIAANGTPGVVPVLNRAYLPDLDGTIFPAVNFYAWLREGLIKAADLIGGIYDATGINTTASYAMYQLTGSWKRMSHAWVDGWPFEFANKGEVYYRNKVTTSGSGIVVVDVKSSRALVEYYPVPDRTGGQTTLAAGITATDTMIPCTDTSGYLLEYGLAQVGSEIVAYQSIDSSNNMQGCIRGLGGTAAAAWSSGTAANELNGRFAGYRYPVPPAIGSSMQQLDVPPDWDTIIQLYVESRCRNAERRFKEANDMMAEFVRQCNDKKYDNATGMLGPKQAGEVFVNEVYNAGLGGGWLLP